MEQNTIEGRTYDIESAKNGLIVLHGGLGNKEFMQSKLDFQGIGCDVAWLDGTSRPIMPSKRTWNAGSCCGIAKNDNIDDVGFFDAVIAYHGWDEVYMLGHSNGGHMIYRYIIERPNSVAKAFIISGSIMYDDYVGANTSVPCDIEVIHGVLDNLVPYDGGEEGGLTYNPVEFNVNVMRDLGHNVELHDLANAEHTLENVKTEFWTETGQTLEDFVKSKIN